MTSPLNDIQRRSREVAERQGRQIQSGQIVGIDRTTLPWTVTAEFVTSHSEAFRVSGITLDPLVSLPDSGAVFVLPRNVGDGAEDGTEASAVAVEVARGESDEASSITGFHAAYDDFTNPLFNAGLATFPGVSVRYIRTDGSPRVYEVNPTVFPWTDDGGGADQLAGSQPAQASVNVGGREINLFVGKPDDVKETALRVWIEPLAEGGRVNIVYGIDPDAVNLSARHVADIPLVHPSAVDGASGKIRTEPANPANTDSASGPGSHAHPMNDHFHEIPILAVRPIRIWYAD